MGGHALARPANSVGKSASAGFPDETHRRPSGIRSPGGPAGDRHDARERHRRRSARRPRRACAPRHRAVVRPPHLPVPRVDPAVTGPRQGRPTCVGRAAGARRRGTVGAIVAAIVPLTLGDAPWSTRSSSSTPDRRTARSRSPPRPARGWYGARTSCPSCPRCPERARCCGAHSPRRPVTSSCSSTRTSSTSTPRSSRRCSARCSPCRGSAWSKGFYRRPLRLETPTKSRSNTAAAASPSCSPDPARSAVPELSGGRAAARAGVRRHPRAAGVGRRSPPGTAWRSACCSTPTPPGLSGLAQVNLGVRKHRNRNLLQLGAMARQILAAALHRCCDSAGLRPTRLTPVPPGGRGGCRRPPTSR